MRDVSTIIWPTGWSLLNKQCLFMSLIIWDDSSHNPESRERHCRAMCYHSLGLPGSESGRSPFHQQVSQAACTTRGMFLSVFGNKQVGWVVSPSSLWRVGQVGWSKMFLSFPGFHQPQLLKKARGKNQTSADKDFSHSFSFFCISYWQFLHVQSISSSMFPGRIWYKWEKNSNQLKTIVSRDMNKERCQLIMTLSHWRG